MDTENRVVFTSGQGVEEQRRGGEVEAQTAGYKIGPGMYHTNGEESQYFVITVNRK